jgi:hypothetical protein
VLQPGKMTAAYSPLSSSSSSVSSGFRLIRYHTPDTTAMIATTSIASDTGSTENPIVLGPTAISPFGPGRDVSDISTLTSIRVGSIPYREGIEWFAISTPVILSSGPACRVPFGPAAPASGTASDTMMNTTAAYLLTQTTSHRDKLVPGWSRGLWSEKSEGISTRLCPRLRDIPCQLAAERGFWKCFMIKEHLSPFREFSQEYPPHPGQAAGILR